VTCGTVSIILSFNNPFFHLFHAGFIGKNKPPHNYFSKKIKTEEDNKKNSSFSVYSSSKELPNKESF